MNLLVRVLVPDRLQVFGLEFDHHGMEAGRRIPQLLLHEAAVVGKSGRPVARDALHLEGEHEGRRCYQRVFHVHQVVLHEGGLEDEPCERQGLHARLAHPGVAPEEAVREGKANVKVDSLEDVHLHLDQVPSSVGVVADVEEIVHARRATFLIDLNVLLKRRPGWESPKASPRI